jgi:hypothetical protein
MYAEKPRTDDGLYIESSLVNLTVNYGGMLGLQAMGSSRNVDPAPREVPARTLAP